MNKQALSAHIGAKMNALGFSTDFTGDGMEAWKKQSADGYMTISAHEPCARFSVSESSSAVCLR
jgi:hypothetical protein